MKKKKKNKPKNIRNDEGHMTRASIEDNPRVSCFQAVFSMSRVLMQCRMGTATIFAAAAAAKSLQLCPTVHDPLDCSLPGSSVHGILQARVLEWGAIAFSEYLLSNY